METRHSRDRGQRVTLLDVAAEAGVSRATASLVVRKSPLVGRATRERVEAAIEELGYIYNVSAARLRRGKSQTIGVLLPNLRNPFFADLLAGIESVLDTKDLSVMLCNSREEPARQISFVKRMREHDVDGMIVCPSAGSEQTFVDAVDRSGLVAVQALRRVQSWHVDYAGTDYADGIRQAVEHLQDFGHGRILFVAGDKKHSAYADRLEGFRSAVADERAAFVAEIQLTHEAGRTLGRTLSQDYPHVTAAVCFNDVIALGLQRGLYDMGLDIGSDFSLVGFDDVPEAAIARPALTSVATRPFKIGENAAQLLLDRIGDPAGEPRRIIEPTKLVIRASTGPIRAEISDAER